MERLGKPRHGREDRRLSEREVSESNLWNDSRDVSASLDMTKGTGEYAKAQGQAPFKDETLCCSLSAPSIKKL
jgi:hypothetical protein